MSGKMEATFYDEAASNCEQDGSAGFGFNPRTLKQTMTLDLNQPKSFKAQLGAKALDILTSPDVGLLKLASPELERLIIQSCNGLTTPTPTHFLGPKTTTDEQEGFAEGFVRALAELHYQQIPTALPDAPPAVSGPGGGASAGAPYSCSARAEPPEYTSLAAFSRTSGPERPDSYPAAPQHRRLHALKEEPQTVPEMSGDTPPLSPIDMENQERIKAERKRMRNRVAASKCRKRKLERISRLEERVKNLKSQNTELVSSANVLRDELALLKQKVMEHVSSGCQLILTQQLQAY
ncbi:transcription factor AP-1 [Nematolebias whitei]|uniref:transcription factor AP-1 n=1 Tax=Nematolebias whitei TaxID=451745 RepID=UPI0018977274|nr:transcription factor AP-1 [Nematolebias whitei]